MKKHTRKKVIIITTVILFAICIYVINVFTREPAYENSDQQYIAFQEIDLPNGSTSSLEIAETAENLQGRLGVNLCELTQDIRNNLNFEDQYGVYVQDILRDSPAQTAGILPGDIITKINDLAAQDVMPTIKLITSFQPGTSHSLTVFRQGDYLNYLVTITQKQHVRLNQNEFHINN